MTSPDSAARVAGRITLNAAGAAAGAAIGALIPGPEGAALGGAITSVVGDLVNRMLSEREKARVTIVLEAAAARIAEQKYPPQHEADELGPMFEGTLLAARDAYEEKKLPILAQLFATAPFTGTPVVNMLGSLELARTLSYRQLCLLAIIPPYRPWPGPELTDKMIWKLLNENFTELERGILYDLIDLMHRGLVVAAPRGGPTPISYANAKIVDLGLSYPATLVHNGARLQATIPQEDLDPIIRLLGA